MKNSLDLIEARLQAFIEGSSMIFPWGSRQSHLCSRLVEALKNSLKEDEDGRLVAPSVFTLFMCAENHAFWEKRQNLFVSLASALQDAARESEISFQYPPVIHLAVDENLMPDELEITAEEPQSRVGSTAALIITPEKPDDAPDPLPANAFLILNGSNIPLRLAVVNIGRRLDNHVIVDDPRVSRAHAQLRAVRGRYLIFDLNSTGGTFINGNRITRGFLCPGDVISLAGVPLVYGEDNQLASSDTTSIIVNPDPSNG